ncbi:MAG: hypothetical protein GKR90_01595 [Pseudomonadales bacterium]|nr:hypothetical protein [Pseudomonadales bacterium]
MSEVLKDIRVVDLTRGPAGGLATMIMADFGAEVLVIDSPVTHGSDQLAATPMWRRGKRSLTLDTKDGEQRETLEGILAGADVCIINWRSQALKAQALDFENVHARHPHLIYCHISGFGSHGPKANYSGYEHLAAAASGRMQTFAGICDRAGPVYSALQVGTHATAQSALSGILAALLARTANGSGRLVETSMLQGMLPYEQGAMIGRQFPERFAAMYPAETSNEPPMPTLHYHPAQAGDGRWVQFGNLLPHLFDNFLMVTDLIDIVADPDFEPTQLALPPEKYEPFRDRMLRRLQDRPADEWMQDCISNGSVVATTYQTTQDALQDPDIVANGHVLARKDGSTQLGPLARMTKTAADPGPPCRADDGWSSKWRLDPRPRPQTKATDERPLAGIRVLEIATIIAAPLGASFLADMGAEVTKIEQISGDPYRGLAMGVGSARVNAGKRSISLNLKSPEGQAVAVKLAANADVLIHNYRPGVPEKLGIGYDQIAAVNPNIIYLQVNGYGPDGPGAQRPSTHPIPGAAMGGVLYQMGERIPSELQDIDSLRTWTRRLMRANEVNPDPNTAMVVCSTALLGLHALKQTGEGQRILIDMFGANAYANHDDFLSYPGKPNRKMPDEGLHGLHATYRLYPCAEDQWIFLAIPEKKERILFAELLAECSISIDLAILDKNDDATASYLSEIFARENADFWEDHLAPQGVGCVRADRYSPVEFWWHDTQVQALNLTQPTEHPAWGTYNRHGANVTFDGAQPSLRPPPTAGQHVVELLTEVGYDHDAINKLFADGVIWREEA